MKTIELIGQVDEQHRLSAQVPADVPPGPIRLALVVQSDSAALTGEDDAGQEWSSAIAREWADELADERQDIYTLSDGEPVDAAG
jgi:hypothetical protein